MKPAVRKFVVIPAIIVAAVAIAAALTQLKPEQPKDDSPKPDLLVAVHTLTTSTERFHITSQGTVRPRTQTTVSAEVSGSIVSLSPKFVAGGVFEKNEELLRIDPTNYKVAVDRAEALVRQRQIEYDGAQQLRAQGYRAETEYASAAAALASAKAELVAARRDLERTTIRLPYQGMVRSKDADLGQFVTPGTQLGVTFATDVAEVRMPLTDQDLRFIELPNATDIAASGSAEGPRVRLTARQRGELREWQARVIRSEGVVDERSRVTYVVAQIDDPYRLKEAGTPLPVGTFVAADIEAATPIDLIRIPRIALRGADQVIVIDDENRVRIRTLSVLRTDERYAYIDGGVEAGERIATTAIEAPVEGMTVRTTDMLAEDRRDQGESVLSRAGSD